MQNNYPAMCDIRFIMARCKGLTEHMTTAARANGYVGVGWWGWCMVGTPVVVPPYPPQ